ncbi:hypothetical protein ACFLIM_34320 [Nonomuraea sp. M3C6]|uniref:Uncharacterized protein n=1 Tax=Nonomuraea marmarensis TaxID=3351344 RepID=A0ABW7AQE3_9ACTN
MRLALALLALTAYPQPAAAGTDTYTCAWIAENKHAGQMTVTGTNCTGPAQSGRGTVAAPLSVSGDLRRPWTVTRRGPATYSFTGAEGQFTAAEDPQPGEPLTVTFLGAVRTS